MENSVDPSLSQSRSITQMAICLHLPLLLPNLTTSRLPSSKLWHNNVCIARHVQCTAEAPLRRSANYQPSLWHDDYIQSLSVDVPGEERIVRRIKKLKEGVGRLILEEKEVRDHLELIDMLQQLGVAYHFKEEINTVLRAISGSLEDVSMVVKDDDLYTTALLFRLVRGHGFNVSEDIFDGFKDNRGKFKGSLCHQTKGILSLYEASFLAFEGEGTLDEARDFTTNHLRRLLKGQLEPRLREHVAHALELPLNWRMPRLHTRWFTERYHKEDNMDPCLLELAKLDFNMVQNVYRRELKEISRWWSNLGLGEELPFSRDRVMENYFWTIGWAFEPQLCRCREAQAKANCLITTIDDIYDVYGTLDELELFTDAVERWDVSVIEQLPNYMRTCFLALFNTTNETSFKVLKEMGLYIIPYLKRAWVDLCKSYVVEAKWYHMGYTPTLAEYLENAWISISGHVALSHAYCVGEDVSKEALESFKSYPAIVRRSSMILRLCNDLGTSTAELDRGDVPKSIQCYMQEKGVSEAVARDHIRELISVNWKALNKDRASNSSFEGYFKSVAMNIPRMAQCMYQYGDGHGKPDRYTKDHVTLLLIEPILL